MTICTIVQTTSRGFAILDIELTRNNDFYNGQKSREWLRPDSSEKSFFETCFRSLNYFVSKSAIRYREKKTIQSKSVEIFTPCKVSLQYQSFLISSCELPLSLSLSKSISNTMFP